MNDAGGRDSPHNGDETMGDRDQKTGTKTTEQKPPPGTKTTEQKPPPGTQKRPDSPGTQKRDG